MTTWDMDGRAALALVAGFTGEAAAIAAAVSHVENPSGVADLVNHGAGETPPGQPAGSCMSVGLWQINYCPQRDASNVTRNPEANKDPVTNARNAFTISGGGANFSPWSTYKSNAYAPHLAAARTSVAKFGGDGTRAAGYVAQRAGIGGTGGLIPGDPLQPLDALGSFLSLVTSWATWRRILLLLAGAAAFVLGVVLMAGDSPTIRTAAVDASVAAI